MALAQILPAAIKNSASRILFVADMAGTLLFGLEGALAGIQGNLDLIGVMVLAFATALGGGIIRDLLIQRVHLRRLKIDQLEVEDLRVRKLSVLEDQRPVDSREKGTDTQG